jgi:hypothetical protein
MICLDFIMEVSLEIGPLSLSKPLQLVLIHTMEWRTFGGHCEVCHLLSRTRKRICFTDSRSHYFDTILPEQIMCMLLGLGAQSKTMPMMFNKFGLNCNGSNCFHNLTVLETSALTFHLFFDNHIYILNKLVPNKVNDKNKPL